MELVYIVITQKFSKSLISIQIKRLERELDVKENTIDYIITFEKELNISAQKDIHVSFKNNGKLSEFYMNSLKQTKKLDNVENDSDDDVNDDIALKTIKEEELPGVKISKNLLTNLENIK